MKNTEIKHFVKRPEVREYRIQDIDFELEVNEKVFPPSPHGSFFAENMKINPGESVIDIGTGSGFLAIVAAKLGAGKVCATDTDEKAIDLARHNAEKNKVNISFEAGEYFASYKLEFDVIIANLPQEIVHSRYKRAIGSRLSKTIDGGPGGNTLLLKFLDIAQVHMHSNSRVYIVVPTTTDYAQTLKVITQDFKVRLIAFDSGPTKEFVGDNINFYKKLNDTGTIRIYKSDAQWMTEEYLFELTKK